MRLIASSKKILYAPGIFFLIAAATFFVVAKTNAQVAQVPSNGLIIGWSTNTYVPVGFVGKRLPTSGSPITAWAVLFKNGKVVDISGSYMQWLVNDQAIQSGTGLQKISFNAPNNANQVLRLQLNIGSVTATVQVPVVSPKVAIEANYPNGVVSVSPATVKALPYFFNIPSPSSLTFAWTVNGVAASAAENPDVAVINVGGLPSGSAIKIMLTAKNSADTTSAAASTNLVYQTIQ